MMKSAFIEIAPPNIHLKERKSSALVGTRHSPQLAPAGWLGWVARGDLCLMAS